MSTYSHESPRTAPERRRWTTQVLVPEMWAALAIIVMWLAVLFDALWGPDIVSSATSGTYTRVPSAIVIAFFAMFATLAIARHGFDHKRADRD